jgi:hypothetical protein
MLKLLVRGIQLSPRGELRVAPELDVRNLQRLAEDYKPLLVIASTSFCLLSFALVV